MNPSSRWQVFGVVLPHKKYPAQKKSKMKKKFWNFFADSQVQLLCCVPSFQPRPCQFTSPIRRTRRCMADTSVRAGIPNQTPFPHPVSVTRKAQNPEKFLGKFFTDSPAYLYIAAQSCHCRLQRKKNHCLSALSSQALRSDKSILCLAVKIDTFPIRQILNLKSQKTNFFFWEIFAKIKGNDIPVGSKHQ